MKKLLVYLVALLMAASLLTACSSVKTVEFPPEQTPVFDENEIRFSSLEEFQKTVIAYKNRPKEVEQYELPAWFSLIDGYYAPKDVPANAKMDYIEVVNAYAVCIQYSFEKTEWKDTEDRFYITTLPDGWDFDALQKSFDNHSGAGRQTEFVNGYFIESFDELPNKEKTVSWVQDKVAFVAKVPASWSVEEIQTYCTAKWVKVKPEK
jgi:hypothetical protein